MTDSKLTYSEPAVLWRLQHPDGRTAHAVIVPRGFDTCAAWFTNERPEEARDFKSWDDALKWLEEVCLTLGHGGWTMAE